MNTPAVFLLMLTLAGGLSTSTADSTEKAATGAADVRAQLDSIIIPSFVCNAASVAEAIAQANAAIKEHGTFKKGKALTVEFKGLGDVPAFLQPKLSLTLKDAPIGEVLAYIAELADTELFAADDRVLIGSGVANGYVVRTKLSLSKQAATEINSAESVEAWMKAKEIKLHPGSKVEFYEDLGLLQLAQIPVDSFKKLQKLAQRPERETSALERKLLSLNVSLQVSDAKLEDVVELLRTKLKAADPKKQGVNIIIEYPQGLSSGFPEVTLDLKDANARDTLHTIARKTGLRVKIVDPIFVALSALPKP